MYHHAYALKKILISAIVSICVSLSACSDPGEWQSSHARSKTEQLVAHAGGRINGMDYTNSLEALNGSKQAGLHFIEIDFEWTHDGHLVLLHDWKIAVAHMFGQTPGQRTLSQFKAFKTPSGVTQITAKELFDWLDKNPMISIITDMKSNELKTLKWIQENYPAYAERFVPQIYNFKQYEPVRRLGYYRVILTLYRIHQKDNAILNFCKTHPMWAVTMPTGRVHEGTLVKDLKQLNIPVYVHTINNQEEMKALAKQGVFGFYIDRTDLSVV